MTIFAHFVHFMVIWSYMVYILGYLVYCFTVWYVFGMCHDPFRKSIPTLFFFVKRHSLVVVPQKVNKFTRWVSNRVTRLGDLLLWTDF
jgi:hypothetical protein